MFTLLIIAAALVCLFWPAKKAGDIFTLPSVTPVADAKPDPRVAIDSLLAVRDRLAVSGTLSPESVKAVDTLWLDLLHGSQPK